ncbi:hypothetical protein BZG01_00125 [Labilibaculum manganireducens]|uniref:Uncharacterized protein n=1 Tax=Labilibaculum manganireducens TaxID=1940525 RepID=A0A2N3IGD1_9BACT|nr:hypothetical protein [Labilibaculum manganireducens]PKQ69379.1 hypothetical protein BZG01_00125 [Labilibaculum manganireducens]
MDTPSNKNHFPTMTASEYTKAIRDCYSPSKFHLDLVEQIQQEHARKLADKHETLIIEALAKEGYKFANQQELIKFAK